MCVVVVVPCRPASGLCVVCVSGSASVIASGGISLSCVSRCVPHRAGVRQGCPLSPLLYLAVRQALLAFLHARGLVLEVDGRRHVAVQYADDTEALLDGVGAVARFVVAMEVFSAASGQRLNVGKSRLVLVGAVPQYAAHLALQLLGAAVLGLSVVAERCTLGVVVPPQPAGVAPPAVPALLSRLATAKRMQLRGWGWSTPQLGMEHPSAAAHWACSLRGHAMPQHTYQDLVPQHDSNHER
jgi:hypothetical protein